MNLILHLQVSNANAWPNREYTYLPNTGLSKKQGGKLQCGGHNVPPWLRQGQLICPKLRRGGGLLPLVPTALKYILSFCVLYSTQICIYVLSFVFMQVLVYSEIYRSGHVDAIKTFTENQDNKRHILDLSWHIQRLPLTYKIFF